MKRLAAGITLLLLLCGCASPASDPLSLRQSLLSAQSTSFQAEITADYGDSLSVFTLDCVCDSQGAVSFTVAAPECIQGITGTIAAGKGKLTFDETGLSFPLLADGLLSPVSAPWVFLRALRSGYLRSWGKEGNLTRLTLDDSFQDDALQVDLWLEENTPVRAEICQKGTKILSLSIASFRTESKPDA